MVDAAPPLSAPSAALQQATALLGQQSPEAYAQAYALAEHGLRTGDSAQAPQWRVVAGLALMGMGRSDAALPHLQQAIALAPEFAYAHYHLGSCHLALQQYGHAYVAFAQAAELGVEAPDMHVFLGYWLSDTGQLAQAYKHFSIAREAGLMGSRQNMPALLRVCTQLDLNEEAEAYFAFLCQNLDGSPDHYWLWARTFHAFKKGDFAQAWAYYEHRHQAEGVAHSYPFIQPRWGGTFALDDAGKTLLIHGEQGLGDEIMFASCLRPLLADAKRAQVRVVLALKPPLLRLFAHNFPVCDTIAHSIYQGQIAQWGPSSHNPHIQNIDYHCPLASLPAFYALSRDDFARNARGLLTYPTNAAVRVPDAHAGVTENTPAGVRENTPAGVREDAPVGAGLSSPTGGYLQADPILVQTMGKTMDTLRPGWRSQFKVGLVWACAQGKGAELDARALPLTALAAAMQALLPRAIFVSLHTEEHSHEAARVPQLHILNLAPWNRDFADTAAIIAHMDVVIGVDTATTHLAGAMGKLVFEPLLASPDWRHIPGERSIWYSQTHYHRQQFAGEWHDVLLSIKTALEMRMQACA